MEGDDMSRDTGAESNESAAAGISPSRALLELDHVYEALGHPRRRYLCYTLLEETEWTLGELATKIAAWDDGVPESAVTDGRRDRVYVSLYHAHVPKLVDDGVVDFDEANGTITAAENAEQVLAVLEGMGASLDGNQEIHARGEMSDGAG
jgi:hypothetical protein